MNQDTLIRLEKAAEKIVLQIPASLDSDEFTSLFNEKFAELIVRECSLFVFKQNGPKSALNLLEHFGVAE